MPILSTFASGSVRGFGFGGTLDKSGLKYIAQIGSTGSAEVGYAVAVDSSFNTYVASRLNISGVLWGGLAKYNLDGALQWQIRIGDGVFTTFSNQGPPKIALDSSGNIHVGLISAPTGLNNQLALIKVNPSGSILWQRRLVPDVSSEITDVVVDSSSNVYIGGWLTRASNTGIIAKYNSSGTLQWLWEYSNALGLIVWGLGLDSSGNLYATGSTNTTGNVMRLSPADGSIVTQRALGLDNGTNIVRPIKVAVDSNGNMYIGGYVSIGGNRVCMWSLDSSFNNRWQIWDGSVGTGQYGALAIDSGNNILAVNNAQVANAAITKYDSSGNILWSRTSTIQPIGCSVDQFGNHYVAGQLAADGNFNTSFIKFSKTASGTGTYTVGGVSVTFASLSNFSSTLLSAISAGGSSRISTNTTTESAGVLTSAATAYTSATTTLA
jgi:hypothetical protein